LWREDDGKAVDEWIAAQKHKKPVYVGAEASEYSERQIQQLQERLESLQQQLRLLGQDNRQWIKVARYTAGCFANYAERLLSERRKQFLDLAQELRIAAQTKHYSAELAGAKSPIHSSVVAPKHQQISTNALRSAARLLKQIKSKTGQQKKIMSTVAGVARLCLKNRASQERVKMKADLLQQLEQLQISQQTSQDKHLPVAQQKATSQTL
jgi:sugar-specific transcriptional regulator TrmB